jgi:hypothetical protein
MILAVMSVETVTVGQHEARASDKSERWLRTPCREACAAYVMVPPSHILRPCGREKGGGGWG